MHLKKIMIFTLVFILSACVNDNYQAKGKPDWIENPEKGVSASAGMHIRGKVAQEELAILRGREEYAKRFGVNIQAAQTYSTTVSNNKANTVGSQVTYEETTQNNVKAMVKEKWRDPETDVLWVWLVPSN